MAHKMPNDSSKIPMGFPKASNIVPDTDDSKAIPKAMFFMFFSFYKYKHFYLIYTLRKIYKRKIVSL